MRRSLGFTLIELMVTIVIVAILAAIAVPSYTDYIQRSRIADAFQTLSGMRLKMEQYFQDNRDYVNACGDPQTNPSVATKPPATTYFTYSCPTHNLTDYSVLATGTGSMSAFKYSIGRANGQGDVKKSVFTNGWPNSDTCWVIKKDGTCA